MALSLEQVEYIADLAKLSLTEDEKKRFQQQLSSILDYAETLQRFDTTSTPPMISVVPVDAVLREDVAAPGLDHDQLLKNADGKEDDMFRVDVILD